MYYLGTITGTSGAAYNPSGVAGATYLSNFIIPPGVKALYLEPSASGVRFALSAATGLTGFLNTQAGNNAALMPAPAVYGPYRRLGENCTVGVYFTGGTYSVKVFAGPTS